MPDTQVAITSPVVARAPSNNLPAGEIMGLLPALDSRRLQRAHVMEGYNFFVDLKGPRAFFGSLIVSYEPIVDFRFAKTFRLPNSQLVICTKHGIYKYDSTGHQYYPIILFDGGAGTGIWTHANVGRKDYFCRRGIGIFEYTSTTGFVRTITSNLPEDVQFISKALGRLVVVGAFYYHWSAQDDGSDLEVSLVTGAGRQGLSIIGGGDPLGVTTAIGGFVVFTTTGAVKAEFSDIGTSTFRHYELSLEYQPINPYCIVQSDLFQAIFLDKRGLFVTDGRSFKPLEELFGEFLTQDILENTDLTEETCFALHYQSERKFLFISVGVSGDPGMYARAWVFYQPKGQWGSFDRLHFGFGELNLEDGAHKGYNFGYICKKGYLHDLHDITFVQGDPQGLPTEHLYREYFNFPVRKLGSTYYFPTQVYISHVNESLFFGKISGLYTISYNVLNFGDAEDWEVASGSEDWESASGDEDWEGGGDGTDFTIAAYVLNKTPLKAAIRVGLMRLTEAKYDDELSLITNIAIGMEANDIKEDWENPPDIEEDWEASSALDEDWGEDVPDPYTYALSITGSNDGRTQFEDQTEEPVLAVDSGATKFYTCQNNGIYHWIDVSANELGQSFHLKFQELSGMMTGRL